MQVQDDSRSDVRKILTLATAQLALQKIIPFPCKRQYTVVVLMPQSSRLKLLKSIVTDTKVSFICYHTVFCISSPPVSTNSVVELCRQSSIFTPFINIYNKLFILRLQVQAGFAGLIVLAFCMWRYSRISSKS